jgi:ABC-type amino acid transport substrate-binding protein
MQTSKRVFTAAGVTLSLILTGCGVRIPSDPDGTLDAVRSGVLQVGVSPNGDLIEIRRGEPVGDEIDAIRAFADSLGADVEWTVGSEEALVRALENHRVDLVAGGLTDQTPWARHAGVTRPYRETRGESGETLKLVMLVPLGENAFLSELETFLADYVAAEAAR